MFIIQYMKKKLFPCRHKFVTWLNTSVQYRRVCTKCLREEKLEIIWVQEKNGTRGIRSHWIEKDKNIIDILKERNYA